MGSVLKMNAFLNPDEWNVEAPTNMHKINLRGKMNAKCGALECKSWALRLRRVSGHVCLQTISSLGP